MLTRIQSARIGALMLVSGAITARDAVGQTVPVVTLAEARERARLVDPAEVAAHSQVDAAAWERRAAFTDLFTPNVRAGLGYTRFSEPFFNFGTLELTPEATSATLEASYTLLGSGKVAAMRRARAALASAEANETAARFRSAFATDAAYYSVLADQELTRVAADRLRRAQEQFGVARARVIAGEAIASDSLQLLLEVNRARLEVLRRDSALAVSRLRLGRRIGVAGPADAAPIDTALTPPLPLSQEEAVAEMHASGPNVEAARAAERRAAAALGAERSGYWPDVTLGASTGAFDAKFFPSAAKRSQLTVTVSWPIWDGGRRELAVARADAQRDAARAERADLERGVAQLVAEAYGGYRTARSGVELALVGVAVATENYRVQRARYREGATTILDLLEAQVSLSEAEATLIQSRYATRLALAQIEALLGRRVF